MYLTYCLFCTHFLCFNSDNFNKCICSFILLLQFYFLNCKFCFQIINLQRYAFNLKLFTAFMITFLLITEMNISISTFSTRNGYKVMRIQENSTNSACMRPDRCWIIEYFRLPDSSYTDLLFHRQIFVTTKLMN